MVINILGYTVNTQDIKLISPCIVSVYESKAGKGTYDAHIGFDIYLYENLKFHIGDVVPVQNEMVELVESDPLVIELLEHFNGYREMIDIHLPEPDDLGNGGEVVIL